VAGKIRFHLDEHVDPDVAAALRRHGIDVTTTVEVGLRAAADDVQLDFAIAQQRVIVTDDADFLRRAAAGAAHPGIVICRRHRNSTRQIIRGLILIHEILRPDEIAGRTEYL
jgi:predicted nuclease of predicted toxin-antitoxin system